MMPDIIPQDITPAYPVQIPDEAVHLAHVLRAGFSKCSKEFLKKHFLPLVDQVIVLVRQSVPAGGRDDCYLGRLYLGALCTPFSSA